MKQDSKLIYSPKEKIPLGEPVILPGGGHGLCVKWKRGHKEVTETIALDKIHELVAQGVSDAREQRAP